VVAVFAQAPVTRPKGTPSLPSRFTELDDPRFTGAPGLVRSDSAPATIPAPPRRSAPQLTPVQQINMRAMLAGSGTRPRPSATEGPDSTRPIRPLLRIDKAVAARLTRPNLPRAEEAPRVTAPPSLAQCQRSRFPLPLLLPLDTLRRRARRCPPPRSLRFPAQKTGSAS
jgi:hypothetical protein